MALSSKFEHTQPIDLCQILSQKQLHEVPPRFIQPSIRRPPFDALDEKHSIPVIDMSGLMHDGDEYSTSEELARACEEWGFFQVINHGIPISLLEKVKEVVKDFLDLPMEEKTKRPMKNTLHHPVGYGRLFDLSEKSILDWVDALIHYFAPPSLKDVDYWPAKPEAYREIMEAYGKEMQKLVRTLLRILSQSLGLHQDYLHNAFLGEEAQFILRVNYYPRCPQPDLVLGLSPHSDGSAITILLHDEVEGLQVKKEGQWCTVQPLPNALIVNMGDMMQLVSNGKYKSVEHRAVVRGERDRVSIVTFFAPAGEAVVRPAADYHSQHSQQLLQPPIYKSVKYADYLANYMTSELEGKARIDALLICE